MILSWQASKFEHISSSFEKILLRSAMTRLSLACTVGFYKRAQEISRLFLIKTATLFKHKIQSVVSTHFSRSQNIEWGTSMTALKNEGRGTRKKRWFTLGRRIRTEMFWDKRVRVINLWWEKKIQFNVVYSN